LQQLGDGLVEEYEGMPVEDLALISVFYIAAAAGRGSYAGDIVQIMGLLILLRAFECRVIRWSRLCWMGMWLW